jgi:hypothetical protein
LIGWKGQMRVTSELWVSALTRRVFTEGGFAAVVRRGAAEAGAIFIVTRSRLGTSTLFGPAPQSAYEVADPDERQFGVVVAEGEAAEIETRIAKESRFDSDIWVVEIEPGQALLEELIRLTKP